jgi:hypothetical protein
MSSQHTTLKVIKTCKSLSAPARLFQTNFQREKRIEELALPSLKLAKQSYSIRIAKKLT